MQAQRKTEQVQVELGSPCVEKRFGQARFFQSKCNMHFSQKVAIQ